jgi:hypothetical protein
MKAFLQRFGTLVSGVLHGFDRLVFRGKLQQLYAPEGMHTLLGLNQVPRHEFKSYAAQLSSKVIDSPLIVHARKLERFRYLGSSSVSKEDVAREFAKEHGVQEGLVCVLQSVEPCWTFDTKKYDGFWEVRGERGKCSHFYHYFIHPRFGWMYVRLQAWLPFEIQVGLNGREWLARQMDRANLKYERSDNKFLWVADWERAQQLLEEQVQIDWAGELDALRKEVHPSHPRLLGPMRVPYNWTVFQSEWATDVAFHSEQLLQPYFDRWLRQAFMNYDALNVLRFLGHSERITRNGPKHVVSSCYRRFDGKRIKHWLYENSLKLYSHYNVLRTEMTINNPYRVQVFRRSQTDPKWHPMWRPLRSGIVDMPHRAETGDQANGRYLEALVGLAETRTVKELVEPLTRRAPEPKGKSGKEPRQARPLNPLAAEDAALLAILSDPQWMIQGLRNRDVVAALYPQEVDDATERRRRSAHVTRLLRLLRAHGLLEKIPGTHRYQIPAEARIKIHAMLALRNANPDQLTAQAA